nr:two pore channel protein 1-like [Pocillopora verrucosa]
MANLLVNSLTKELEAAIFLMEGKNNNRFETHPTPQTLRWYLRANSQKFYVLELMAALILLALGLTEKPPALKANNLSVPVEVHAAVEVLSLVIVFAGLAVKLKWQGAKFFFSYKRTRFTVFIWCVVLIEAIVVLVRRENHFRVTRSLRPLFLIETHYCSGVRRVLRQILRSLPPILYVLFLLFFIMVIFAMLGFYLFSDNEKDEFFSSFGRSFISLFVLLTTANYPDVMMPAYNRSRWSVIYFAVYIAVVLYFLMSLLLAVVYDAFTNIVKNKFSKLFLHKREGIRKAYELLKGENPPHGIPWETFKGLMSYYDPKRTDVEKYLCFKSLNKSNTGQLSLDEFYNVFENSEMRWKRVTEHHDQWFSCFKSRNCLYRTLEGIHRLISEKAFEIVIYVIIFTNGISVVLDIIKFSNTPQTERQKKITELHWYHIVFICIYATEALLKLLGLGLRKYFRSGWNIFDLSVTVAGFIGAVSTSFSFIVCVRPLRLLLLFKAEKRYRDLFETIGFLLPRMARVAVVILLMYYSFGVIGIECFSGLELKNCCVNTSWERTYKEGGYHLNNFDDLLHSYVTLFELTVVNNWFIIMEGIVYLTSDWASVFFMLFYIVTMVVMTIVVAFILEAFRFRIKYRQEHPADEEEDMKIRMEIIVTYEELLALGESYVEDLQPHQPVHYEGKRPKTKMDLRVRMYDDEVKQWIQNEEPLEIGEPSAHAHITEDTMAMSPTNSPSSSVPANTSSNGLVTDEVTMGEVNIALDE